MANLDRFGLTPELAEFIKNEERWSPRPYLCPAGKPTIGWGHRIPSLQHPPITKAHGLEILEQDLRHYRDMALRLSPGLQDEPEARLAAVIDFCFNAGGSAYAGSTLRKKVDAGQWKLAGLQMRRWVWGDDPENPGHKRIFEGLVKRRAKMAKWLEEGHA